ncbi:MAG: fimbrillin family protein, partial [Alistipes sp.]|nr:fimbrillin family protein [Alistipes sp.]
MKKLLLLPLWMVLMTLSACADSENTDTLNPTPSGQLPLQLEATMEDFNRADDTAFNEGDRVGLYLFTPQTYIDNALLTYSEGSLVSQQPLYWHEDSEVAATLVAYYPYN